MTPSPEQTRQGLINTLQQPRNHAPVIFQAIKNEKPGYGAGSLKSSGQANITEVTLE